MMPSATLFEALTGYEHPAKKDSSMPDLLGAAGADGQETSEPSEGEFTGILQQLQAQASADPQFARKLKDAFGVEADAAFWKDKLQQSRDIVAQSRESALLGAGAPDFSEQEEALQGPELLGVPDGFSNQYIEEHVVERYWKGLPRI